MSSLASVEDARASLLGLVSPGPSESVALARSDGRVLAEPVVAGRDQPPFAASAMDGWAVRAADGPAPRRIVGESAAGRAFERSLAAGEAVRIFTGAPVPTGADLVVIQEEARRDGQTLHIAPQGEQTWIRPAGLDFRADQTLLAAGARLDPWRLALAAAAGRAELRLVRRPSVALLPTGEEVVPPGASPAAFQIFESASTALSALLARWGASARTLPVAGDDEAAIAAAVAGADAGRGVGRRP
jgi:molybdopterin molybdotransferase